MQLVIRPLVIFLAISLVGCDKSPEYKSTTKNTSTTNSTINNTQNTAVDTGDKPNPNFPSYVVTTDATNAPYELRDDRGTVVGFDVDLIKAVAKEANFNVTIVPAAWDGIFDSLNSGEKQILLAPLTITPERLQQVDFSIPYIYPTRTAYMYPETAAKLGINTYQDLPKAKISAKVNTSNINSLIADFGESKLKLLPADSQYLAFKNMVSKQADVAFGDTAVMQYHAGSLKNEKFVTIEQTLKEPVEAGFAVKKGNKELADKISDGIRKTVKDGTYKTLAIKWFGEELGKKIADRTQTNMDNPNSIKIASSNASTTITK